jgi:meckelin
LATNRLACVECGPNATPVSPNGDGDGQRNAKECSCENSYLQVSTSSTCTVDDLLSGKCTPYLQCSTSCRDQSLATSLDQLHCAPCGSKSSYDISTGDCICPLEHRRVEIYDANQTVPAEHDCLACPTGTAVIDEAILAPGQRYHVTAGASFKPDPYTCAHCPDSDMMFDDELNCVCREGFIMTGEASVGTQTCVSKNHLPSISSSYSKVKFNFVTSKNEAATSSEIDSIMLSHYYLEAASSCEFSQGNSERTRNACQSLMNLCVLSSYDNTAAACRQLASLSRPGEKLRNHIVYDDEVDAILRDRSIQMQMSFRERLDFEHTLDFRLAKYAINGEFMGFETLKNQFLIPCGNIEASTNPPTDQIFRFGRPFSMEHKCSVDDLMEEQVYFYELFLVDKGAQCGSNSDNLECLYPIPVLTTSFREGDIFPNINKIPSDELDDKFVNRFVTLDNMVS